jgi:hypothetical protein
MDPASTNTLTREIAFRELQELARESAEHRRLCYGASAKPVLQKRLPGFNEVALGYLTFREFLRDAESYGAVRLDPGRGGDVNVVPASTPTAVTPPTEPVRIRRDLWTAMMVPGGDTYRYEPESDIIKKADGAADGNESGIEVPTVGKEAHSQWIDEFVDELAEPKRLDIQQRLQGRELEDKLRELYNDSVIRQRWYAYRMAKVLELLEAWKAEHGLDVEFAAPMAPRRPKPAADRIREGRAKAASASPDDRIRARVHDAVDRMPLSELLRLSIPIEFLVDH